MPLSKLTRALLLTLYEYLMITFPVGLYIFLEAAHEKKWSILWISPKWSVATIFLLFQGITLYVRFLNNTGGKVSPAAIGIGGFIALALIIVSTINTWMAFDSDGNSKKSIAVRLGILFLSSILFGVFVWGARQYLMKGGRPRGQDE
jgi:hypothetical protein